MIVANVGVTHDATSIRQTACRFTSYLFMESMGRSHLKLNPLGRIQMTENNMQSVNPSQPSQPFIYRAKDLYKRYREYGGWFGWAVETDSRFPESSTSSYTLANLIGVVGPIGTLKQRDVHSRVGES